MSEALLLPLGGADLAALLGDDPAAHQRYRMLVALVREGRPVVEVARAFGVSRESLRRLRREVEAGNLAALRPRRRGGGHFARGTPLARAIRDELAAEPGAPTPLLWQRVAQRLAEQGARAPRSTFYRLLGRLRAGADAEAPAGQAATRLLREALGGLLEDPPLTLGRTQLAALLLPDERDTAQRGRTMAEALRAAIAQLRPPEGAPPDDPRWRWFAILSGEYLEGQDRGHLQSELALSASTYSRAKRDALLRLRALLPAAIEQREAALPQRPPDAPRLDALAEAAREIGELLTADMIARLTPEQHLAALDALAPIAELIQQLREPYEQ